MSQGPSDARRRPTYADIEALPAHLTGEIIAGELVVSPRPAPLHIESASALGILLGTPFRFGINGPGGWWIEDEPELRLGIDPAFDPVVPDLAGWRHERMPHLPSTAWFELAPDWLCEILSPSTASSDRAEKMPFYKRAGVGHLWLLDPILRTLEVYRRTEVPGWHAVGVWRDGAKVRAEPFDAIELDLALLWGR